MLLKLNCAILLFQSLRVWMWAEMGTTSVVCSVVFAACCLVLTHPNKWLLLTQTQACLRSHITEAGSFVVMGPALASEHVLLRSDRKVQREMEKQRETDRKEETAAQQKGHWGIPWICFSPQNLSASIPYKLTFSSRKQNNKTRAD